jgi:hypothetical protein
MFVRTSQISLGVSGVVAAADDIRAGDVEALRDGTHHALKGIRVGFNKLLTPVINDPMSWEQRTDDRSAGSAARQLGSQMR